MIIVVILLILNLTSIEKFMPEVIALNYKGLLVHDLEVVEIIVETNIRITSPTEGEMTLTTEAELTMIITMTNKVK